MAAVGALSLPTLQGLRFSGGSNLPGDTQGQYLLDRKFCTKDSRQQQAEKEPLNRSHEILLHTEIPRRRAFIPERSLCREGRLRSNSVTGTDLLVMRMSLVGKIALSACVCVASVTTGQTFTYSLLPA